MAPTARALPLHRRGSLALEAALYLGDRWDCVFRAAGLRLRASAAAAPPQRPQWVGLPAEALWIL